MSRTTIAAALALLLGSLAGPAAAQSRAGIYAVAGNEPGKGTYQGRVELRWTGTSYAFIREVEFQTFRYRGRPVSTVWTGTGVDDGLGGVDLSISLDRMGWASAAAGLPSRSAADGVPMAVQATFSGTLVDLSGRYLGPGAPFADPNEVWQLQGPPGPAPIWEAEREVRASHGAPGSLTRQILFALFGSYHQVPWVQPFVGRQPFQDAIHYFVHDRTDYALHRSRPDLLRVIQQVVDPLNLEEAIAKADGFGRRLVDKAAGADAEVPTDYLDPAGPLAHRTPQGFRHDNDGALWTGVYAYTQALRHRVTQSAAARQNLEHSASGLWRMMAITGTPTEFARTVRATQGLPVGSGTPWRAGSGSFAGVEWKVGGNNDMFKGLLWGGLAIHEGLGGQHALRQPYGQALDALVQNHAVAGGNRRIGNKVMGNGVAALLTGDAATRDRYRRHARNPFYLLYQIALGGGFYFQGISDWSGTHLNVSGLIIEARLADLHGETIVHLLNRYALRRAAKTMGTTRRILHTLAASALGNIPFFSPVNPEDGIWGLRELPFPRPLLGAGPLLRQDFCVSPYPNLPWKNDWTTNQGRAQGYVAPPLFAGEIGNYVWKNNPFQRPRVQGAPQEQDSATDYLFAYWLARANGVIGAND